MIDITEAKTAEEEKAILDSLFSEPQEVEPGTFATFDSDLNAWTYTDPETGDKMILKA